jgi:ribonuclease HI
VAEYRALIAILQAGLAAGAGALTVYGDSKVVIDDVTGATREPVRALAPLREQARALMARYNEVQLRWVPRHRNPEADALSQRRRPAPACGAPGAAA